MERISKNKETRFQRLKEIWNFGQFGAYFNTGKIGKQATLSIVEST